jgi:Leucine-rich repeat (LRR) protein
MDTVTEANTEYDTDIHPEVIIMDFKRCFVGDFFKDNRFPNLDHLLCSSNQLTTLKLNCPSLQMLWCSNNQLTALDLNCPSLQELWCYNNQLTNLNGLEFCEELIYVECSESLSTSVKILKTHLPKLKVRYR